MMAPKRQASATQKPSGKKQKKDNPTTQTQLLSIEQIKIYQSQIAQSPKYYNNIVALLSQYQAIYVNYELGTNDENVDLTARFLSLALFKIFKGLISNGDFKVSKKDNEQKRTVVKWLKSKYEEFKNTLFKMWNLNVESEGLYSFKVDILDLLIKFLNVESQHLGPNVGEPYFPSSLYRSILTNLLQTGNLTDILSGDATINNFLILEFQESYFSKYWDLKYFFFNELLPIVNELSETIRVEEKQLFFSNVLTILKQSPIYDEKTLDEMTAVNFISNPPLKTISNITQFNSNFEKSWLQLMNLPLLAEQYKSILLILHKRIIPYCNNPTKLMDFLTESYNMGFESKDISISILSLNGLWELMKGYNLEYPDFFTKLYAILTVDLLHLSYKSRFLRLLDIFMSSTHLSSAIVASFIKRFSRLSLTAPPSGIVCVIPFIYNLLKRHPTCMLLIHSSSTALEDADYQDPFHDKETDPSKTDAINSSLWELESMIQHYHPNVASLAKIFTQPFNKYSYNIEDFLDWSYGKLLESELNKRFKGELSVEFERWDKLLGKEGYLADYDF